MYLDDINEDENPGVAYASDANTPSDDDYRDMVTAEQPEEDEEEAIDNYLNVELILNTGTDNERRGRVIKRSRFIFLRSFAVASRCNNSAEKISNFFPDSRHEQISVFEEQAVKLIIKINAVTPRIRDFIVKEF